MPITRFQQRNGLVDGGYKAPLKMGGEFQGVWQHTHRKNDVQLHMYIILIYKNYITIILFEATFLKILLNKQYLICCIYKYILLQELVGLFDDYSKLLPFSFGFAFQPLSMMMLQAKDLARILPLPCLLLCSSSVCHVPVHTSQPIAIRGCAPSWMWRSKGMWMWCLLNAQSCSWQRGMY